MFLLKTKGKLVNPQGGFTLIEVLTAMTAIAIVSTTVATVVISSLSNVRHTENRTLGTRYAQEGMEAIREIKKDLISYSGTYCLGNIANGLTVRSPCNRPNIGSSFIRTVQIEHSPGCGTNLAKVVVTVSWSDEKCPSSARYCHDTSINSCFATASQTQAP